jgi:hypothetical protein
MKYNVGSIDRLLRIVIGMGIIIAGLVLDSYWGLLGVALLATAIFKFCPLYFMLKITTNKKE